MILFTAYWHTERDNVVHGGTQQLVHIEKVWKRYLYQQQQQLQLILCKHKYRKKNTLANTFFSNHFLTEQKWKVLVGVRKQKEFVKTSFEILNVSFLNKIPNIIPSTFLASNTFTSNENRYAHGYASKEQSFWILFFKTAENREEKMLKVRVSMLNCSFSLSY